MTSAASSSNPLTPLTVSHTAAKLAAGKRHSGLQQEVSAGGIVVDRLDGQIRVAVIARINRAGRLEWCLPKGHLENQENSEQAAVREVAEETGLNAEILGVLGSIDYWFFACGQRVHKTVHHFLMKHVGGDLSAEMDPDHEVIDVAWIALKHLDHRLTFANERHIANLARYKLEELK